MTVPKIGISWLGVKLGLRMLVKQPGMTFVAVFALAIGIPVGLAPIHLVNAYEAPLPVDDGDRIQLLRNFSLATSRVDRTTPYELVQWREALTTFEAIGALRASTYNLDSDDGLAPLVRGASVTASTFDILRVPPLFGRTLLPSDEVISGADLVVT